MNRIIITAFLVLLGIELNAQTSYQLSYMEVYKNNKIISKGALDVDELVIDENGKKISIIPPEYKPQIFKIIKKTTQDDEIIYHCEMINPNGIIQINLILNKFYKYLKCIGEGESGDYIKYYFK